MTLEIGISRDFIVATYFIACVLLVQLWLAITTGHYGIVPVDVFENLLGMFKTVERKLSKRRRVISSALSIMAKAKNGIITDQEVIARASEKILMVLHESKNDLNDLSQLLSIRPIDGFSFEPRHLLTGPHRLLHYLETIDSRAKLIRQNMIRLCWHVEKTQIIFNHWPYLFFIAAVVLIGTISSFPNISGF